MSCDVANRNYLTDLGIFWAQLTWYVPSNGTTGRSIVTQTDANGIPCKVCYSQSM